MRVVLPAPLGPRSPIARPCSSTVRSWRIQRLPSLTPKRSRAMTGVVMGVLYAWGGSLVSLRGGLILPESAVGTPLAGALFGWTRPERPGELAPYQGDRFTALVRRRRGSPTAAPTHSRPQPPAS